MSNWVEEIVSNEVRIMGQLSTTVAIGSTPLTYVVERNGETERGPFGTFDEAMRAARELCDGKERASVSE